jgi:hypothetical protein
MSDVALSVSKSHKCPTVIWSTTESKEDTAWGYGWDSKGFGGRYCCPHYGGRGKRPVSSSVDTGVGHRAPGHVCGAVGQGCGASSLTHLIVLNPATPKELQLALAIRSGQQGQQEKVTSSQITATWGEDEAWKWDGGHGGRVRYLSDQPCQ